MDPRNFFSNSPNMMNSQNYSQDYYPNLDNIHIQDFENNSNPQFPNNLTHENVQPTDTNNSGGPKGWTDQEDLALMYAWCNASSNPIVGTNQNGGTFWGQISEMYEEARADHSRLMGEKRSIESLRNRYKRLNTNVTKWVAVYKEAYDRKSSGMSDADVEKEAQKLYGKSKFTHLEVFEKVMHHHPKWELKLGVVRHRTRAVEYDDDVGVEDDRGSSKKSRTTEEPEDPNDSTSETHVSETSTIRRPAGREKAKAKRKGKATVSQHSAIPDEYTAELQAMRITREKEVEAINRMGDMRMQSNLMVSKMNILNTLMGKSNLSPEEESLKYRLMAELFP
ncbi:glutathione S-transferase T3-like [Salvia miltiorrhiza]|uniref:glutathione S-transferase T3-like n=1 Tax=Salvia miltiorrhiza TaxID=226208 RepID=UPI0025AB989E|nr:glutathione S-transferase T3-like [Salvia miltiorrhiza]